MDDDDEGVTAALHDRLAALVASDPLLADLAERPLSAADMEALIAREQGSALALTLRKFDGTSTGASAIIVP